MDTQPTIRIVIVDDHAMLRKGLAAFLRSYPDLKLVGEAVNGKDAVALCARECPDIVLMDLMMPIMNGIAATHLIRANRPETQVIALTSFSEARLIKEAIEAGAISYLFKNVSADDLTGAIRAARDGMSTYAPEVSDILAQSIRQPRPMFESLTLREREVLSLIVKGMGNSEIADSLTISLSTTKSHVSSVLSKLGVSSRTEAIVMIMEHNINWGAFEKT
jgi:NarL family two-component system response regulator LiaR